MGICYLHGIIGLQGLWDRQTQTWRYEKQTELKTETWARKRLSTLEASYSLSSWDKDCNSGRKLLWCAKTACCNLFFDEPSGASNHSTLCSVMVRFLADYCKTLRKNNEKSAQNKLHRRQVKTMRVLNTRLEKRIMRLLTNSATKLVVSVSSTGSELLLSVSEKRKRL